jgi:surfactin synthase thioesterase subunit
MGVRSKPLPGPARWMLRPVPADATAALLCFPYSGVGASSYRGWPREIAGMAVVALQPPGRENRLREPRLETHAEFAMSLADALLLLSGRPFGFFGHCGAVPYMLETVFELERRNQALPSWIIASSWGAPQSGLYGALNFVDLETHDFHAMAADLGLTMSPELVGLAVELLRFDQIVQRGYRFPAGRRVPVPVATVGWSDDRIVPPEVTVAGWEDVATTRSFVLDGAHGEYLSCPAALQELVAEVRRRWPDA